MNRCILECLAVIGFFCAYAQGFLAPADVRDCREIRLIQAHDSTRTRIARNKKVTDTEKATALAKENIRFTAKMVELQHLKAVEKPRPKCTNRCPYFFRCKTNCKK